VELNSPLFSEDLLSWLTLLYGAAVLLALWLAPWRKLRDPEQLHLLLGSCVVLTLLWHMRAQAEPQVAFHLLGVTALTLMYGWSFALLAAGTALVGVVLNGKGSWEMFPINAVLTGLIPITLSQISLILVRSLLPKNFFIFVLGNGFLTAGLVGALSGWTAMGLLAANGVFTPEQLAVSYLPFFPLMFFPEAFLNGWIVTVLVCYRPQWVYSFSDELYLKGK
jgi:uncharacterized membrane protein